MANQVIALRGPPAIRPTQVDYTVFSAYLEATSVFSRIHGMATDTVLRDNWPIVTMLADRLLQDGTLPREMAIRIMWAAVRDRQ